jgi:sensor histidine kinase regulating citrate/malate metabolism
VHTLEYLLAAIVAVELFAIFQRGKLMSVIKDAADAMVTATTNLIAAADALIAAFQSGNPADIQAAIDELTTAKAAAETETANINAALNPPPAAPR